MEAKEKIKHLFWRAGFGMSPEEWKSNQNLSINEAVEQLFTAAKAANNINQEFTRLRVEDIKMLSAKEKKELRKKERRLVFKQNADWVKRMANPGESALLEKMCLFWHGHFACITKGSKLAYHQLNTIRKHALGSFRDLVHAMAKDVSMIRFLNNQQNRKRTPNENFARELLELFTIGRGQYTEQDIKEAARAFTGWSSDLSGTFVFRKRQHDFGNKTFMGKTGDFNGDDIIDIVLKRRETAEFIVRKVYRYFVNDKIDKFKVQKLTAVFYHSDYDIEKLMRRIFTSDWFYAPENIGVKIKSPVELMAGIMRTLHVNFKDDLTLRFVEKALGQILFNPPNVAGWPGGKTWIDNSTLMLRLNLVGFLFQATDVNFKTKEEFEAKTRNKPVRKINADVNLNPIIAMNKQRNKEQIFKELSEYLLQVKIKVGLTDFKKHIFHHHSGDFIKTLVLRLMSMPEYQMC